MPEQKRTARLLVSLVAATNYVRPPEPPPGDLPRERPWPVRAIAALPDVRIAVAFGTSIHLWNIDTRTKVGELARNAQVVQCLLTLRDGRLASGASDNNIRIWDVETCVEVACLDTGIDNNLYDWGSNIPTGYMADCVRALVELPDRRLAAAHINGSIRIWDLDSGKIVGDRDLRVENLWALAALPDGRLAAGACDQPIHTLDPTTLRSAGDFKAIRAGLIVELTMLPDRRLASTSSDDVVRIWNPTTGTVDHALYGHKELILGLAAGPKSTLVTGSMDKTIRLWDAEIGESLAVLEHDCGVSYLRALADGRILVGDDDGRLLILEVQID